MRQWAQVAAVGALLVMAAILPAFGQSDSVPLGDVARAYRKNQDPPQKVIDNDNLPQVMDQGESKKWALSTPKPAAPKTAVQLINFESPNVTCALSFSANSPDILANAPRPQRLPDSEVAKLDGPASIVGGTLELSVLNATGWDVREITVGLTIVRKQLPPAAFLGTAIKLVPTTLETPRTDRKQADVTVLYHLHGAAAPYSTALFREELERPLEADEEWHWSILQAKGMPPAPPASDVTQGNSTQVADGVAASAGAGPAAGPSIPPAKPVSEAPKQ